MDTAIVPQGTATCATPANTVTGSHAVRGTPQHENGGSVSKSGGALSRGG